MDLEDLIERLQALRPLSARSARVVVEIEFDLGVDDDDGDSTGFTTGAVTSVDYSDGVVTIKATEESGDLLSRRAYVGHR